MNQNKWSMFVPIKVRFIPGHVRDVMKDPLLCGCSFAHIMSQGKVKVLILPAGPKLNVLVPGLQILSEEQGVDLICCLFRWPINMHI